MPDGASTEPAAEAPVEPYSKHAEGPASAGPSAHRVSRCGTHEVVGPGAPRVVHARWATEGCGAIQRRHPVLPPVSPRRSARDRRGQ